MKKKKPRKIPASKAGPVVVLHPEQTYVRLDEEARTAAVEAAFWVTASPHEWEWSLDAQAAMARYVLWAYQRLSAIHQLSSGADLPSNRESRLLRLCRELDMEMDGVACPASAAAILNAIRGIVAD